MSKRESKATELYDEFNKVFTQNVNRNRNTLYKRMYMRILSEIAMNRFKWTGLPDTVDPRYLEFTLFNNALCVFYWDREFERFLALAGNQASNINHYNNPTEFVVYGSNQINKRVKATHFYVEGVRFSPECVPIWANYLRRSEIDMVSLYATRLADLDVTIDVNMKTQRHPFIVSCTETQRLSLINAFRQVEEGQPVIWGSQDMGNIMENEVQALNVGIEKDTLEHLLMAKDKLWAECMTYLGINNANQNKKERLVADEVGANDSQVLASRLVALTEREHAVRQINALWPQLDIGVEWRQDDEIMTDLPSIDEEETDGPVYDTVGDTSGHGLPTPPG